MFQKFAHKTKTLGHIKKTEYAHMQKRCIGTYENPFLVSGCGLACQQEISLVLAKTPPIHYWTVMNSSFSNYAGSCVFNTREHRVSRGASVRKRNLRA